MNYCELTLIANPELAEILIAELADLGFESFVETDTGLQAYIPENEKNETETIGLLQKYGISHNGYAWQTLEKKNWNLAWEESYQPVRIDNKILIRASFHPAENHPYEIVINPKMSFGTGHHETTELMLRNQLSVSHQHKKVLDAGCGTGILAIMAAKLGAAQVSAFDIEDWAVENTRENCQLNGCDWIQTRLGTISDFIHEEKTDILLANINRNILLDEMRLYAGMLKKNGYLLISGFYEQDAEEILRKAAAFSLVEKARLSKNNWMSLQLKRAEG